MAKHISMQHLGVDVKWEIRVVKTFRRPMLRQMNENVRISQTTADIILNSRSEFHQAPIVRVVPVRGLISTQEDQHTRTGGGG